MKYDQMVVNAGTEIRRSPCGERGLKFFWNNSFSLSNESLPVRGAWIEIKVYAKLLRNNDRSLPVRGAWIEISRRKGESRRDYRRSPCGERGLKLLYARAARHGKASLPVRGAWIEISRGRCRPRCGGRSLPVRGAWIEISPRTTPPRSTRVAPRAGSVD